MYFSEAVFFFPFVAGAAVRVGFSLSEPSSSLLTSEALLLALSSFSASAFFFGAALGFRPDLVAFGAAFGAGFLLGALA